MFYKRQEGEILRCGFNYTKTCNGHGITLLICLPDTWRMAIGYYWGLGFSPRFDVWNQRKADEDYERYFNLR